MFTRIAAFCSAFSDKKGKSLDPAGRRFALPLAWGVCLLIGCGLLPGAAQGQDQTPASPTSSQSSQAQDNGNGKPKQDAPAEAGGPTDNVGPYVIPKKTTAETPPPPPPPPKKVEDIPDYSLKVNVPLVNVDVLVTTKDGQFVPGLKKENFRIIEDGVPQTVSKFNVSEAPVTAVLLVEFASTSWQFLVDALNASYAFASTLKKDDWVAVAYYDMQPHILTDFTQDKRAVFGALNQLRIPGFAETNEFDALYDTLDRLDRIEGKKYIILVSSGVDTFSKLTLDKITKKVKDTKDVTIFPVSIGWYLREMCDNPAYNCTGITHGMASYGIHRIDYLQADNEMRTFAAMTGGRAYFPRFQAEFAEIFHDIGDDIRHQYSLAYSPTNTKLDGTYRKLKVQVVAGDGGPLKVRDQKGKDLKIEVVARDGYTAKHTVD
jgi:VWFA-related protein